MIMKHGEIEYKSDKSYVDKMPHLKDCSDVDIVYPVKREYLILGVKCVQCTSQRGWSRSVKREYLILGVTSKIKYVIW
jgi:hypothetical protein